MVLTVSVLRLLCRTRDKFIRFIQIHAMLFVATSPPIFSITRYPLQLPMSSSHTQLLQCVTTFFASPSFKYSVFWSPWDITSCYHHTPQFSGSSCLRQWPHSLNWFGWLMKREKYGKGTKQGRHLLENNISKKKEKKRSVLRCVLHSCKCNFEGDTLMVQEKTTKPHRPHSALLHSSFLLPPIPPPARAPSQNYLHFEVEFVPLPATCSCCFLPPTSLH